jgi:C1A family cysteine protease
MRRYGWRKDLPDHRDHIAFGMSSATALPPLVDLRPHCPPVYDQGDIGSCTANAIAGAIEFDQISEAKPSYVPSRLFIYYNERAIEDTTSYDSGAQIRDGIKTLSALGFCPESDWPYDESQLTVKPPTTAYSDAQKDIVKQYARVMQSAPSIKGTLAHGHPVVFGFTVYESFESDAVAATGIVPMPGPNESALGGHAVLCVGYDDSRQAFIVRNSWGASWGDAGYFYMPYDYLLNPNLASDFWMISFV